MLRPLLASLVALFIAGGAKGALVHRYSFDGNVADSVGDAHGTIVDAGEPNARFDGGVLDVSSNVGYFLPSVGTQDAYVTLPSDVITNAFNANVPGELTIEIWAQASENRNWASLFSAGIEAFGGAGLPDNYIQIIPQAAGPTPSFRVTSSESGPFAENYVDRFPVMSTTEPTHLVVSFHSWRRVHPFFPRYIGEFDVHVDGALVGSVEYDHELNLHAMNSARVYLGRSQYSGDPIFDGLFDELRIYDSRLSAEEIARNYAWGPNAVPEPQALWLIGLALTTLAASRHRDHLEPK